MREDCKWSNLKTQMYVQSTCGISDLSNSLISALCSNPTCGSMPHYCPNCGKELVEQENPKFCPDCGTQLRQERTTVETRLVGSLVGLLTFMLASLVLGLFLVPTVVSSQEYIVILIVGVIGYTLIFVLPTFSGKK